MKKISKIKVTLIFISVIIGFIYATPNFISNLRHSDVPNFLPGKTINLGLDLKGGSYLLLKADMDVVFAEKLEFLMSDIRSYLRKAKVGYRRLNITNQRISFQKRNLNSNKNIKECLK